MLRTTLSTLVLALTAPALQADSVAASIENAMFGEHRSAAYVARNRYRHPVGTLTFFGLDPSMTVIEISPGGGWYTEVLAPVLHEEGQLVAAIFDDEVPDQPAYRYRLNKTLAEKFEAYPEVYGAVRTQPFSPPESASLGEAGSADMVLTFRNTHGWINDDIAETVFAAIADVLKPGGVLGIVQHRAPTGTEGADMGYVAEQTVIDLAAAAGLTFEARSDVNANPRDTKDHPEGVWTLPPSMRLGDEDRAKYEAIGESDRMTLRFRKTGD